MHLMLQTILIGWHRITFKYSRYLFDVDQGHVAMIRRVQEVVGAKYKEY